MTSVSTDSALPQFLERIAVPPEDGSPKSAAMVEVTMLRGEMSPLHLHDESEAFHVLEGSIVIHAGDEHVRLEAGDAFVAPNGVPHTHRADSNRARYLTMTRVRSIHRYEDFLRAVALPADRAAGSESPADDEAVVSWLALENGIEVLGPPGTLP